MYFFEGGRGQCLAEILLVDAGDPSVLGGREAVVALDGDGLDAVKALEGNRGAGQSAGRCEPHGGVLDERLVVEPRRAGLHDYVRGPASRALVPLALVAAERELGLHAAEGPVLLARRPRARAMAGVVVGEPPQPRTDGAVGQEDIAAFPLARARLVGGNDLNGTGQVEAEAGEEGEDAGAGSRLCGHSPTDLRVVGEEVIEPGEHASTDVNVAGNGHTDREIGPLV